MFGFWGVGVRKGALLEIGVGNLEMVWFGSFSFYLIDMVIGLYEHDKYAQLKGKEKQ